MLLIQYPPDHPRQEERENSDEEIVAILSSYGGRDRFVGRAAYFRFEDDFHGFIDESMEVFDSSLMPCFEENTINDAQYRYLKEQFKSALLDICLDITDMTKGYVGYTEFRKVTVQSVNSAKNISIIILQ